VQVDKIIETFANCPLPNVQEGDEMQKIGDAVGSFVQWPKKDIILLSLPSGTGCLPSDAPTLPEEVEQEVAIRKQVIVAYRYLLYHMWRAHILIALNPRVWAHRGSEPLGPRSAL